MCDKYNGWSNYPTWNWKLWIDNEQGSQEYWQERAEEEVKDAEGDCEEAAYALAKSLEAEADEAVSMTGVDNGPVADILGWAMQHIDWREIADSMIGNIDADRMAELVPSDDEPEEE